MTGRVAISKRVRFEVFKRDGFACQYCGAHPPAVLLHVDHIDPVAEGGGNEMDNLVTACEPCNLGKGAVPLSVIPESLADKTARIAESEEQLAGYAAVRESKRERIEADAWRIVEALTDQCESWRHDYLQSIRRFLERLPYHDLLEAAELARAKRLYSESKLFRYFCAVCWNKIREAEGE